jgi:uncharacterized membrane protein YraQ (UPF0718 family)
MLQEACLLPVAVTLSPEPVLQRPRRKSFDWSLAAVAAIVGAGVLVVFLRDGYARVLEILLSDFTLFGEMLGKVLAGCLIGVFLTFLLPREKIARWIGHESGFTGLLVAMIAGFILPGGPITMYTVAGAFLVIGADVGATVAFLTSWTLLGYTRALVWELPFFGPDFVIWRIILSLPLPLVAGLLARILAAAIPPRDKVTP